MFAERRKYKRVKVAMALVAMESIVETSARMGTIKGISVGGVGIETKEPFNVDDLVELNFVLDNGYEFHDLVGRIVRVTPGESCFIMGIQFMDIKKSDRTCIGEYVEKKLQEKNNKNIIPCNNMIIFK